MERNIPRAAIHVGTDKKSLSSQVGNEAERRGWDEKRYQLKNADIDKNLSLIHICAAVVWSDKYQYLPYSESTPYQQGKSGCKEPTFEDLSLIHIS